MACGKEMSGNWKYFCTSGADQSARASVTTIETPAVARPSHRLSLIAATSAPDSAKCQ